MSPAPLARRERRALCDLALALGEDAPTLCGDWSAKDLVAHLLVREYRPWAAVGLVVPPLAALPEREMARVSRTDFTVLVERLRRRGPTVFSLPAVDKLVNTVEYFVHHEDLRRAQPDWEPRRLTGHDQDTLWKALAGQGRVLARRAGVPLRVQRPDTGATATLRSGEDPVVLSGEPAEAVLFLFGRDRVRGVDVTGPDDRVERFTDRGRGL